MCALHRANFIFFDFENIIDLFNELIRQLLNNDSIVVMLVFAHTVFLKFFEKIHAIATHVCAPNTLDCSAYLCANLTSSSRRSAVSVRDWQSNQRPINHWIETKVGFTNTFLNRTRHSICPKLERKWFCGSGTETVAT